MDEEQRDESASVFVYVDPAACLRALDGLGRELQGLNHDEPVESLEYALQLLRDALVRVKVCLAVNVDQGEPEA